MAIIALDPATKCGWSVWVEGELTASGTWHLPHGPTVGSGAMFRECYDSLDDIFTLQTDGNVELVVYEAPANLKGDAIPIINGLIATIEHWAERRKIPYRGVSPGEAKNIVGCKGNAKKFEVMAAVNALYPNGAATRDDNECDAIAVGLVGMELLRE